MKTLQFYSVNIVLGVLLTYSLYTCITCVVNYWALPVSIILFFILAWHNGYIE